MKSGGPLRRLTPLRRTKPKPTKPTAGSGIRPAIRDLVRLRDNGHCRRCGRSVVDYPASIHHRLPRGRGGTDDPANLAVLCGSATTPGSCHEFVESRREQAYDEGWLLVTGFDPSRLAVTCWNGIWVLDSAGDAVCCDDEATS